MTSQCHNTGLEELETGVPNRDIPQPILDATRASVMAVGVRRTTLTDVARRAGVSRMTVYRRFGDVTSLLQALMTREFGAMLRRVAAGGPAGADGRERFVAGALEGVAALGGDPLFRRILDVDPELLLPYAFERLGAFQHLVLDTFAALLRAGMDDGSIRRTDPEALAAALELLLRGWVLAARAEDPGGLRARAFAELGPILHGALR